MEHRRRDQSFGRGRLGDLDRARPHPARTDRLEREARPVALEIAQHDMAVAVRLIEAAVDADQRRLGLGVGIEAVTGIGAGGEEHEGGSEATHVDRLEAGPMPSGGSENPRGLRFLIQ